MNRSTFPPSKRWNFRQHRDDESDDEEEEEENELDLPQSSNDDDEDEYRSYHSAIQSNQAPTKKRKLNSPLNSSYEFRPRGPHPSHPQWDNHSTSALLDAWGDRFLHLGRSSLRADDWIEVSERVSEAVGSDFGVSECRNRLHSLRSRYKKEKLKIESLGGVSGWCYFKKMSTLMTVPGVRSGNLRGAGLACGVDAGEFVFKDPDVYLERANAVDEMRDSPDQSEDEDGGLDEESYRVLAESVKRVGELYERTESGKRDHAAEMEKMRMEFQRDLEMQKKEMLEKTRVEIERLQQDGDGDGDGSAQTASDE